MKKFLLMAAMAVCLVCYSNGAKRYTVKITNGNFDEGTFVYVQNYDTKENVDSAVVFGDSVIIAGKVETPFYARLIANGERLGEVIIEPGNIVIGENGPGGTPLNDKFKLINDDLDEISFGLYKVSTEEEADSVYKAIFDCLDNAMGENIDNPIGYRLVVEKLSMMKREELDSLVNLYPNLKDYKRVADSYKVFDAQDATAVGKKFTDFEIEYDGEVTKLSDIVGKGHPVLVDMWASWCGPCRREASTTLMDIYNEYNDKGLEIVGIAVWDEPENTLDAIEKMQLPWRQVLNGQNVPTDAYGVLGIPFIILFDADGTIVSRNLQGDELKASVAAEMSK